MPESIVPKPFWTISGLGLWPRRAWGTCSVSNYLLEKEPFPNIHLTLSWHISSRSLGPCHWSQRAETGAAPRGEAAVRSPSVCPSPGWPDQVLSVAPRAASPLHPRPREKPGRAHTRRPALSRALESPKPRSGARQVSAEETRAETTSRQRARTPQSPPALTCPLRPPRSFSVAAAASARPPSALAPYWLAASLCRTPIGCSTEQSGASPLSSLGGGATRGAWLPSWRGRVVRPGAAGTPQRPVVPQWSVTSPQHSVALQRCVTHQGAGLPRHQPLWGGRTCRGCPSGVQGQRGRRSSGRRITEITESIRFEKTSEVPLGSVCSLPAAEYTKSDHNWDKQLGSVAFLSVFFSGELKLTWGM